MSCCAHLCGVAPRGANRRHISPGLPTCGHDSWARSPWCAQPTPVYGAQARHVRKHDAQPDHDRAAWYGKHIRGLFVLGMVVGQRVEQDLELVEISQLNRQLRSDLRVRNELKEGLQCLLEVLNREPFNCGWCEIRRMQGARRHRRDSATVRSIGSTRNCRHARHKQAAVRLDAARSVVTGAPAGCVAPIYFPTWPQISHLTPCTWLWPQTSHIGSLSRFARAFVSAVQNVPIMSDEECEFASRFRRVLVNWLLQSTLPGMVRHA